ncbi:hypothetical protein D9M70_527080 [compost metagenome]
MPAMTDAGHSVCVLRMVCTSPFGSAYVASSSSSRAAFTLGTLSIVTLPAPSLFSVSGSLSAITRVSFTLLRSSSPALVSAAVAASLPSPAARGGLKLKAS